MESDLSPAFPLSFSHFQPEAEPKKKDTTKPAEAPPAPKKPKAVKPRTR